MFAVSSRGGGEGNVRVCNKGTRRLIALDREGLINNLRDAGIIPPGRYPETKETKERSGEPRESPEIVDTAFHLMITRPSSYSLLPR